MSRSYKTRRRVTDTKDIEYLRLLGATEKLLSLEKTSITYETTEVQEFFETDIVQIFQGSGAPVLEDHQLEELPFAHAMSIEQQQAVSFLSSQFNALGFGFESRAIPESTGGVTVEMLVRRERERVLARKEGGYEEYKHFYRSRR